MNDAFNLYFQAKSTLKREVKFLFEAENLSETQQHLQTAFKLVQLDCGTENDSL